MNDKSNDPSKQQQHFLPKQYLSRFAHSDGKLRVERSNGESFQPTPGALGKKKGLYDLTPTFPTAPTLGSLAEKTYKEFEDNYGVALASSLDKGKFPSLDQAKDIARFAVMQAGRTPHMHTVTSQYLAIKSKAPPRTRSDLVALGFLHNNTYVNQTVDAANIEIYRFAGTTRLLTSDNPSTLWVTDANGARIWVHSSVEVLLSRKAIGITGSYIHFPITPTFYMRINLSAKAKPGLRCRNRPLELAGRLNVDTVYTSVNFSIR